MGAWPAPPLALYALIDAFTHYIPGSGGTCTLTFVKYCSVVLVFGFRPGEEG